MAHLLNVLGFEKVGAIYDGDKEDEYKAFCEEYDAVGYRAWIIPAEDIRDKEAYEAPEKTGLLQKDRKTLKPEYAEQMQLVFKEMEDYLKTGR